MQHGYWRVKKRNNGGSMKVYFIRHGATRGNREHRYVGKTDEAILSEEWNALKEMGEELGQMDGVFVSPLLRCVQSLSLIHI